MSLRVLFTTMSCLLPCAWLVAEDDSEPAHDALIHVSVQDVLDDEEPADDQPPDATLPPVVVEPPEPDEAIAGDFETGDGLDLSSSFPDLSQLQLGQPSPFGQNSGILRGRVSLFDTPAAASIRTRQEIAERQAPDMLHALQNEVGVLIQATAAGQASPFIRGLTGQQVLILVDGIRLNNSIFRNGPNQYFNTIDPGMVDHIEVLRGQGSVLWGADAIGGAINVVSRGADVHQGMFCGNYAGGEFTQFYNTSNSSPYSRLNVEGWVGQTGFFGGGSFLNVRNLDTAFDDFPRQPGTNYQQYAGDLKFNYLIDENRMLTFAMQHVELENVPRSDRFPGYPGDRDGNNAGGGRARFFNPQQRDLMYLRYQALDVFQTLDAVMLTASYHRQREVQERELPKTGFQETDVETVGLNLVASKDLCHWGKWVAGVDWYHDDVDSPFGGSASGPIVPDDAYYERFGVFLNWDVALTDRLTATVGVRYEHVNTAGTPVANGTAVFINTNFDDWVGQAGLVYEVNPCLHLVGSISEGFRPPNLDDLMANNPNVLQGGQSVPSQGLIPERSISYELGVKTNYDRLRAQTFVFWLDLQEQMVPIDVASDVFATANQDSFIQGVELDGEYLLSDCWSVYGNFWYTFGKNRITQSPLNRIPPTQGILGLRYRTSDLRSYFAIYTWMSRRQDRLDPVKDVTDERIPIGGTPGFATLNLRMGHAFGCCNQHRLSLSLENITDQPYLVHGSGVFGTGATARLGYTWVR